MPLLTEGGVSRARQESGSVINLDAAEQAIRGLAASTQPRDTPKPSGKQQCSQQ